MRSTLLAAAAVLSLGFSTLAFAAGGGGGGSGGKEGQIMIGPGTAGGTDRVEIVYF